MVRTVPKRLILLGLVIVWLLPGCDSDGDSNPAAVDSIGAPSVTGIFVRDDNADIIGFYGDPQDGGLVCFPNPANLAFSIHFMVPEASHVRSWVVRARGPGESQEQESIRYIGAEFPAMGQQSSFTRLLLDEVTTAGIRQLVWAARDDEGRPLPGGFYRIYVQIGEEVLFGDVFLWHEDDPVPPGMEQWLLRD